MLLLRLENTGGKQDNNFGFSEVMQPAFAARVIRTRIPSKLFAD